MKPEITIIIENLVETLNVGTASDENAKAVQYQVTSALLKAVHGVQEASPERNNGRASVIEKENNKLRYAIERTTESQKKTEPNNPQEYQKDSHNPEKLYQNLGSLHDLLPASILCSEVYQNFFHLLLQKPRRDQEKLLFDMFHEKTQLMEEEQDRISPKIHSRSSLGWKRNFEDSIEQHLGKK
jgi:hypothetical protein